MYLLQGLDKALEAAHVTPPKNGRDNRLADDPFFKSFMVRYPALNAQPIQDFYDNLKTSNIHYDTITHVAKAGPREDIPSLLQDRMPKLAGFSLTLGRMRDAYNMILLNPKIAPADKGAELDRLNLDMINVATEGNKLFHNVRGKR